MPLRVPVIGLLRERVTIQQEAAPSPDGGGGYAPGWTDVAADLPARIEPAAGREEIHAAKLASAVTTAVTIRTLAGVAAGMRVVYGGRVFNIRAVLDIEERRRFMMLACEEGVAT